MTPMRLLLLALLLPLTLAPAHAGAGASPLPEATPARPVYAEYYRDVIAAHADSRDGRRVLAAAMLSAMVPPAERLQEDDATQSLAGLDPDPRRQAAALLYARAVALAPRDPLVLWTVALAGRSAGHALADHALEQLLAIDADNAAVWIEHLHRHGTDMDAAAQRAVLERAAAATRHALYYSDLAQLLAQAFAALELPASIRNSAVHDLGTDDPRAARLVHALGIVAALALPSLQTVSTACSDAAVEEPSRRTTCRALGWHMATGADSVLGERMGLRLWQRAAASPGDAAEQAIAQRNAAWRMAAFIELSQSEDAAGGLLWDLTSELWTTPGLPEPELQRRTLAAAGVSLEPPAGFEPSH